MELLENLEWKCTTLTFALSCSHHKLTDEVKASLPRKSVKSARFGPLTLGSVKVKIKVSLCLIKHHPMKTYWGVEV